MRISRLWNKDPFWFSTLDNKIQSLLIAEYRLTHETAKERKKRQENANKAKIKQRLEQLRRKEAFYD